MEQNVGNLDKAGRAVLAAFLFGMAWKREDKLGVIAAHMSGVLVSSVISGYCPLYKLINVNTAGEPPSTESEPT